MEKFGSTTPSRSITVARISRRVLHAFEKKVAVITYAFNQDINN